VAKAQQEFWNWFVLHEAELFDFDPQLIDEREKILSEVARELQKVDPDLNLTFEFGPKEKKREFVVSAGGIKRGFPAVLSLASAAPRLDRWIVTAFRPRRQPLSVVALNDKRVDPKDVEFSLRSDGKTAGIYLFIPGFREDAIDLKQIGYLLLDEALGEYDVEIRLGLIKMLSPQTPTDGERHPLIELPERFDKLVSRLGGRTPRSC